MKFPGLILLFFFLLCGCRPATKPADPATWEYGSFEYKDAHPSFSGNADWVPTLMMNSRETADFSGIIWGQTNAVYSVQELLNKLGQYGWQLSWTDGAHYILKRPAGLWTNGDFAVYETEIPNSSK